MKKSERTRGTGRAVLWQGAKAAELEVNRKRKCDRQITGSRANLAGRCLGNIQPGRGAPFLCAISQSQINIARLNCAIIKRGILNEPMRLVPALS